MVKPAWLLRVPMGPKIVAEVRFYGGAGEPEIDKLIRYLELCKESFDPPPLAASEPES